MKARVKSTFFMKTAQSAGMEFIKSEWRFVPDEKVAEVSKAPFLETLVEHEINASDVAIEIAAANGIDLRVIEGSGKDGKIIKPDVEKLMKPTAKPDPDPDPEIDEVDDVPEDENDETDEDETDDGGDADG